MKLFRKKKSLNITILHKYRHEALEHLRFIGSWSGYWVTVIDGIRYCSCRMSGFKYIMGDCGTFIQDAIIDRVYLKRNSAKMADVLAEQCYGQERWI